MSSDTTASTDKFLFLFKPQVDDKCVFGISLKIAVRIVSVFLILVSLSEFFEAFSQNKLWVLLWNIFFAIFFLSIAIFAFLSFSQQSTTNMNTQIYLTLYTQLCL